jgi:hypothetical protein
MASIKRNGSIVSNGKPQNFSHEFREFARILSESLAKVNLAQKFLMPQTFARLKSFKELP